MNSNIPDELKKMIKDFEDKLSEAQDARYEIMEYLSDKYGIDTSEEYEYISNEYEWCDGINIDHVESLIEGKRKITRV